MHGMFRVQTRVTNDEVQDQETASYAYEWLERLASLARTPTHSKGNHARKTFHRARQERRSSHARGFPSPPSL